MTLTDEQKDAVILLIEKARIKLMESKSSFFGHILLQLKHDYNAHEKGLPTVAVSADTMYYNLMFLHEKIKTIDDMIFILMHEIMHVVLEHLDKNRIGDRDPRIWNYAGDYVINLELVKSGYKFSNTDMILYDVKYAGLNTEQVYDIINENQDSLPNICNDGTMDDIIPSDDESTLDGIKDTIIAAYNSHVLEGGDSESLPEIVKDMVDNIKKPILPWNRLLARYMSEIAKNDFSWSRLNLNYLPEYYIPTLHSDAVAKIDVAIDVSGSIDRKTFDKFINEVKNILMIHGITKVGIYQFNTINVSYDVVSNIDEIKKVKFYGGGGTDIADTLRIAAKSDALALFIITDGYMNLNLKSIRKPTIWCVYNNKKFKAPFGQTILFDKYIK